MSEKQKRISWLILLLLAVSAFGLLFIAFRKASVMSRQTNGSPLAPVSMDAGSAPGTRNGHRPRNLSLQPAPSNLSQRLGQRFRPDGREQSVIVATLTLGNERKVARIARKQKDSGEEVTINVDGSEDSLTWSSDQGALRSGRRASGSDRELIERLVLDSPDQFVLAQLRGASYYPAASDVRPVGVGDDYTGPRWNIVRVDDPDQNAERRPQSSWRLYYLNTETGLIDRIVSQTEGETVEAQISTWTDHSGEKIPSQIDWIRQGKTVMQFRLTNFSHTQQ